MRSYTWRFVLAATVGLLGAFTASARDLAPSVAEAPVIVLPRVQDGSIPPWAYAWLGFAHTHSFDGGYVGIMAAVNGNITVDGFVVRTGFSKGRYDAQSLLDRKSTRLNSSHIQKSRMPSSA